MTIAEQIPLRWLVREVDERANEVAETWPLLSVSVYRGVERRDLSNDGQAASEDVSHYKRVSRGEIAINKLRAFQGGIGLSDENGLISPAYGVLRLGPHLHGRYVHHLMRSQWFVGELTKRLRGLGAPDSSNVRTPHVNVRDVLDIPVPVPPLETQRRIADYLDTETARIDTLITKNTHAATLVEERRRAALYRLADVDAPTAAVWQLAGGVTSGPRDWGDYVGEQGDRPFVRITNIPRDGFSLNTADLLYVTPPIGDGQSGRVELDVGDVVVSITADIGSVAVVDATLAGAAFNQHVARIRPGRETNAHWLALCLRTVGRPQFERLTAGGTKLGLSLPDVRSVRIPMLPMAEQRERATAALILSADTDALLERLRRQRELLVERRQALITAAVTGEIEV